VYLVNRAAERGAGGARWFAGHVVVPFEGRHSFLGLGTPTDHLGDRGVAIRDASGARELRVIRGTQRVVAGDGRYLYTDNTGGGDFIQRIEVESGRVESSPSLGIAIDAVAVPRPGTLAFRHTPVRGPGSFHRFSFGVYRWGAAELVHSAAADEATASFPIGWNGERIAIGDTSGFWTYEPERNRVSREPLRQWVHDLVGVSDGWLGVFREPEYGAEPTGEPRMEIYHFTEEGRQSAPLEVLRPGGEPLDGDLWTSLARYGSDVWLAHGRGSGGWEELVLRRLDERGTPTAPPRVVVRVRDLLGYRVFGAGYSLAITFGVRAPDGQTSAWFQRICPASDAGG
jgi:hypothetical protein